MTNTALLENLFETRSSLTKDHEFELNPGNACALLLNLLGDNIGLDRLCQPGNK